HARENGADVREETSVDGVEFTDAGATLDWNSASRSEVAPQPGEPSSQPINGAATKGTIHARYLIDASGRNSLLGTKFNLKKTYRHLQKLSIFAHYDGMARAEGIDGTLTTLVRGVDRWFWIIPLTPTRTSVGVVLDGEIFKQSKKRADEFLEEA